MDIRFHNTLTHRVEPFAPIDPPHVYMYNCGPTVYDYAHIGNFRTFLFADLLRRFLELAGHQVHQVMNITDVGHMTDDSTADGGGQDKMQLAAQRIKEAKKSGKLPPGAVDNPDDPHQVADFFTRAFLEDARALGLKIADDPPEHRPRATQHVPQMQELIARLIAAGHAYVGADGCVYYDVQSFPDYGQLSGNTLDKLRAGAGGRVSQGNQAVKKHPADFLLWKPDPSHLMKWDSPWGAGYPGWHIECSAMARQVLGQLAGHPAGAGSSGGAGGLDEIDIHTGGEDNIFPHHECEIAQSRGASGRPYFARLWMHSRHLLVNGQKMSKSKGTFHTVRDVLEGRVTGRPVDPAVLRLELLKAHYRSTLNFTVQGLRDSASAVQRLQEAPIRVGLYAREHGRTGLFKDLMQARSADAVRRKSEVWQQFTSALASDLNMPAALGVLFGYLNRILQSDAFDVTEAYVVLNDAGDVMGIPPRWEAVLSDDGSHPVILDQDGLPRETAAKCAALDAARKAKDFATADRLRRELQDAGYEVQTPKAGSTVARKKLA